MSSIVIIKNLKKVYAGGLQAPKDIYLEIERGEILALLAWSQRGWQGRSDHYHMRDQ